MTFCLLLLPRPTADRYTMLPPLLPLHEQRQQWQVMATAAVVARA